MKRLLAMNASLKDRLDRLMQMVEASTNPVTEKERSDYERWVKRVESIRGLRNDYAHGRWMSSNGTSSDDPEMTFVPLQWAMGSKDLRPTVTIRLIDLEKQAKMIPALCDQMRKVLVPFLEYRQHPQGSVPDQIANANIDTIWVGPNYPASRIFVLGESWYGDYADNTDRGYIALYLANKQADGMYTKMANACRPDVQETERKAAYWNSIMFTNFVQRVGDKRTDRPTKQHYVEARARLLAILQTHKPKAVWVLGKEQAEHSTQVIQSAGIPFVVTAHPTSYGLSNQALGDSWRQLLSRRIGDANIR